MGALVSWGCSDLGMFIPMLGAEPEKLDKEVYNIVYHLKQQRSEVMSWSTRTRTTMWNLHLKQLEFERKDSAE